MNSWKRIRMVFGGLFTILCSILIMCYPDYGLDIVIFLISCSVLIHAVRSLIYYFTLARYMVGGRIILYRAVICFDLAIFMTTLANIPSVFVMIYLIAAHLVSGVILLLQARDARAVGSGAWRLKAAAGAVNILVSLLCLILIRSGDWIVYIYCAGLIYSACMHIAEAFQKTAVVYIP